MHAIRELTLGSMTVRILLSILLGGLLGIERGMKNRPAGLRTYMLVCLGSCIVMLTNQYVFQAYQTGDPVRMAAQVVSGIGFLGAGTIIVTSRNQIKGLTTAAGLWAAACVGLALGIGLYEVALIGGASVFVVLTVLHRLDYKMRRNTHIIDVYVELKDQAHIGGVIRTLRACGLEVSNIQLERDNSADHEAISFIATLKGEKRADHSSILKIVNSVEGIAYVEEL